MQQTDQYIKLVNAIEFFSQRFSLENMLEYIYDFSMELIHPSSCVLIVESQGTYKVVKNTEGYNPHISFPKQAHHDELVYFHAGLVDEERLGDYIPTELFLEEKPKYAIPLIMDKSLLGFVVFNKERVLDADLIIANALMNLFSLSLSHYDSYNALEQVKKKLDAKVFNLFAINQASKALLSELNVRRVVQMTNSVFSELTQSRITSIYIYDTIGQRYECMGMIDVYNKVSFRPSSIQSKEVKNLQGKMVIDYEDLEDQQLFKRYFSSSIHALDTHEPKYIINLVNDGYLLGFVTLSKKINNTEYDREIFELIESLASATYIAVINARNVETLKAHRQSLDEKITRLQVMNTLVKNLNLAQDIDALGELALETLKVAFGYKTSCLALYNPESNAFSIRNSVGFHTDETTFFLNQDMEALQNGRVVIKYSADDVADAFAQIYTDELYDIVQGAIIVPMHIDYIVPELIGVVCLFSIENGVMFSQENLLTLETISNHIAPMIKQLNEVENVKAHFLRDEAKDFKNMVAELIDNMQYSTEAFYVIIASAKDKSLFSRKDISHIKEQNKYCFWLDKNTLAILVYTDHMREQLCSSLEQDYVYEVLLVEDGQGLEKVLSQVEKTVFSDKK
ncbi:GAF domain-containing protein [Vallitaleaceae bacterium 9-2]